MNKKEDVIYEGCILAVKSTHLPGVYLHRVRVWAKDGTMLVAMRMLSSQPYVRGTFIKMQPDMPPGVAKALRDLKAAETAAELEAKEIAAQKEEMDRSES